MILINNKKTCAYNIHNVVINPAVNTIKDSLYKELLEVEFFQNLVKTGALKVMNNVEEAKNEVLTQIDPFMTSEKKDKMRDHVVPTKVKGFINKKSVKPKKAKKSSESKKGK